LELQGNDNTSETETYVTLEVETEVQNRKTDPEAISKTPGRTTATISRAQKVKVFREDAREGLEEQAKEMKATSSKKFQKPTLGQNTRNQFILYKENFSSIEEVGTEEISVREVVNKRT